MKYLIWSSRLSMGQSEGTRLMSGCAPTQASDQKNLLPEPIVYLIPSLNLGSKLIKPFHTHEAFDFFLAWSMLVTKKSI